jgi:hypothetical protein
VRNEAKAKAGYVEEKGEEVGGEEVGGDMTVLIDFKPAWIRTHIWKQMIDLWNTPAWRAKSLRNRDIRSNSIGGKHTLGSQSYATVQRKAVRDVNLHLLVYIYHVNITIYIHIKVLPL